MELNEALKVVLELAEQNMLNDPEMQDEMLQQMNQRRPTFLLLLFLP